MAKRTTTKQKKASAKGTAAPATRKKGKAGVATLLPLALSLIPGALALRQPATPPTEDEVQATAKILQGTPKEFSIPVSNLQQWANSVLVTLKNVKIEGNSG